jgi:hypothetical protein
MANKKLYLLSQKENNNYDTYDSLIVCSDSIENACKIDPHDNIYPNSSEGCEWGGVSYWSDCWADSPEKVTAVEIGVATDDLQLNTVVLGSFNAA